MKRCRALSRISETLADFDRIVRAEGFSRIAGVDEAGRGPLAGPVVAAAVILPENINLNGINDSKKLSPARREELFQEILYLAEVSISYVSPEEIDSINILKASLKAMKLAIEGLTPSPDIALIDGPYEIEVDCCNRGIAGGDSKSLSIAAASIVAKVFRDRLMNFYHRLYPDYGFDQHKGYPTRYHLESLAKFGPSPIHRKSFNRVSTRRLIL
ncbi:MAG: ribonuclease HII [Thermodesulforhabdaceae bacterium]